MRSSNIYGLDSYCKQNNDITMIEMILCFDSSPAYLLFMDESIRFLLQDGVLLSLILYINPQCDWQVSLYKSTGRSIA